MKRPLSKTQLFFKALGIIGVVFGLYAFYDFGRELIPLFAGFVQGSADGINAYLIFTSFFLGAPALTWTGMRLFQLRSFSKTWLFAATFVLVAWLYGAYDTGVLFEMDRILSFGIQYVLVYVIVNNILLFAHKNWFTPVSHEMQHHVGLEKPTRPKSGMRTIIVVIILAGLLILHPADIKTTVSMLFSPFTHFFGLLLK